MPRALGYKADMEARDERVVQLARANTQRAAYQLRLATAHKERMMAKRDRALLAAYYAGVRPFESAALTRGSPRMPCGSGWSRCWPSGRWRGSDRARA